MVVVVGKSSGSIAVGWCSSVVDSSGCLDVDVVIVGCLVDRTRLGSAIARIGVRAGSRRSEMCDNGVRW